MATTPPGITPLPTPPSRSDPLNFSTRADAFLGALPTFQEELDAVAQATYDNAVEAADSATLSFSNAESASNNAAAASANAVLAAEYAGAAPWVSGTTYPLGRVVWSPANQRIYRRIVAGAGTTDPSADPTNWAVVQGGLATDGSGTMTGSLFIEVAADGAYVSVKGGTAGGDGGGYFVQKPDGTGLMAAFGDSSLVLGGTPGQDVILYSGPGIPMSFNVSGAERMYLHPDGLRIGGSGVPLYALDVKQANASIRLSSGTTTNAASVRMENGAGTAFMGLEGSAGFFGGAYTFNIWHQGNTAMAFATNNVEAMRINPDQQVLVGTTAEWSGYNSRMSVHYAGAGTEAGITLNSSDNGATQSRAMTFLAGGSAAGGGAPSLRGWINQNNAGLTLASAASLFVSGGSNIYLVAGGVTAINIDNTGLANYGNDEIGWRDIPQVGFNSNTTLVLSHRGKGLDYNGTGGHTLTIPANSSVAFPIGSVILVTNTTANNLSIDINTDTLRKAGEATTGIRTLGAYGVATLRKVAATTWFISGVGLS